jgi:hypothetical protein
MGSQSNWNGSSTARYDAVADSYYSPWPDTYTDQRRVAVAGLIHDGPFRHAAYGRGGRQGGAQAVASEESWIQPGTFGQRCTTRATPRSAIREPCDA